jgi:hypothetical protein
MDTPRNQSTVTVAEAHERELLGQGSRLWLREGEITEIAPSDACKRSPNGQCHYNVTIIHPEGIVGGWLRHDVELTVRAVDACESDLDHDLFQLGTG